MVRRLRGGSRTYVARIVVAVVVVGAALSTPPAANAETAVQQAHQRRAQLIHDRKVIIRTSSAREKAFRSRISSYRAAIASRFAVPSERFVGERPRARSRMVHEIRLDRGRLAAFQAWTDRRLEAGQAAVADIDRWLATVGIFERCPVPSFSSIADNFGITVDLPGVPVHRHQGDDIAAPGWSPIVAPFDGYASASSSDLGGLEVRVRGERGYVYNAHLVALGRLGYVRAGDTIGYVGVSGDATGPHDHFEWHPWGEPATDPNPYLVAACVSR